MNEHSTRWLDLLRQLIKPALRICLRNSVAIQEIIEATKEAYVELASEELRRKKTEVTVSRISVMTCMNRRDITRIFQRQKPRGSSLSIAARVISTWEQNQRFLTKAKKPKTLTYRGTKSEFKSLVESVSKDLKPATVLFELERVGAVEKVSDGIKLIKNIDFFTDVPEKGLKLLCNDAETLVNAVEENLFNRQEPRNLHLRTEYSNIFKNDVPFIRQWFLEQGALFHRQARELLAQHDKDLNPNLEKEGGAKVVFGTFSWSETEPEA